MASFNFRMLRAVERQSEWLRFSGSPNGERLWEEIANDGFNNKFRNNKELQGMTARQVAAIERMHFEDPLKHGDVYYVGPEFCNLVEHARKSLPDATFDPRLVPSKYGFVWFDVPMTLPLVRAQHFETGDPEFRLTCQAFGWRPVVGTNNGVQFTIYQPGETAGGPLNSRKANSIGTLAAGGFWPLSFFTITEGESLAARMQEFEDKFESGSTYAIPEESWRHEIRLIYTLLLLANQRVARVTSQPLNRAARKIQQREHPTKPHDHFKVITLRRYEQYAKAAAEREASDEPWYTVQFDVRGHWRMQWYQSLGYHQAIWIDPFVKGNPNGPFKGDERRIFAVTR